MGNVKYYLKKPAPGKQERLIYLQYKFEGKKLVFSFGLFIDPGPYNKAKKDFKNWNPHTCRVKENKETVSSGDHSINNTLDKLEDICIKAYKNEKANGAVTAEILKKHLQDYFKEDEPEKRPTLYKLIEEFIKDKDKATDTRKKYITTRNRLQEFEKSHKYPINFETITIDFFDKYHSFLKGKGLMKNSIAKDIQILKAFMNKAVDRDYTTNINHRKKSFSAKWEESENVYLTREEIKTIFKHDFSKDKILDRARDLFVFGCCTGLRFSDFTSLKPEHIVKREGDVFIKMLTKKTNELVIIHCNEIVLQIFDKYQDRPNKLPASMSNVKFNEHIKTICKEAGLQQVGRLTKDPTKPLHECISSHTARRSFATNLYNEGFPAIDLMKITGHKIERAFLKYIKNTKQDAADRLASHQNKSKANTLRIA